MLRLIRALREEYLIAGGQMTHDRREARCLLGMIYRDQNRPAEAERVLQELLGEQADFVRAWVGLGYVYLGQRRYADLNHVCQQLLKCQDGQVYSLLLRAEALLGKEELSPARPLIDRAIELAPKMVWARFVLASWLLKAGAPVADCQAAQRDILRLDPGNAAALDNLRTLEQWSGPASAQPGLCWTITV